MKLIGAIEIVGSTFVHSKMRTFLTIFAVSIGMGAITVLVSLGFGLQKLTIDQIANSQALLTFSLTSGNTDIIKIDNKIIDQIKSVPEIEKVGENYAFSGRLIYQDSQTDTTMYLVDQNFLSLEDLSLSYGETYKDEDDDSTLIISEAAAKSLGFDNPKDALGKSIKATAYFSADDLNKAGEAELKVVAVTKEPDNSISYAPIGKFTIPQDSPLSSVKAKVKNAAVASSARSKFENMGLSVYSVSETINRMNQIFRIVQYVLAAFGLIALGVASIGMFNTLTISLLERTREIGIMRVLGATAADIKKIFLIEAVLMGFGGGAFGLASGWLLCFILNATIASLANNLGGQPTYPFLTPWYFAVGVMAVSLVIGFLTGLYPARRAAKLNPLDALRYE